MLGVEKSHCNAAIKAVLSGYYELCDSAVSEALNGNSRNGKDDTLGMDNIPETEIVRELQGYDNNIVVLTEESASREDGGINFYRNTSAWQKTIYISDPTDRSSSLRDFLIQYSKVVNIPNATVGQLLYSEGAIKFWEERFSSPAIITGSSSAISCIRYGLPIFSVIINYLSHHLFVSCPAGNYYISLSKKRKDGEKIDLDYVIKKGKKIVFRNISEINGSRKFVAFTGKSLYEENLLASGLVSAEKLDSTFHHRNPGGPLRILYLSTLQPTEMPISFILANGEKISEWVHWLAYIRFSKKETDQSANALCLAEVWQERPYSKDDVFMSTPPAYSIFKPSEEDSSKMIMDVEMFARFSNPSKIRATLVVAPANHPWATLVINQRGYRVLQF